MLNAEELLSDLTEPQRRAVTHVDGPLLIVAGAGSGKTRVITRRVAHLVSQGIAPRSILAITFTNKAAGEMKQRIGAVLEHPIRDWGRLDQHSPMICTFHSLCLRVLKHYAPAIGLAANFSVYDSSDQNKLIKDAIKTLDLSTTNFPPAGVHGAISNAKNKLLTVDDFTKNAKDFYERTVARVYAKYQQLLKANNALDFDDLLLVTADAFRKHQDVLKELQQRFVYIMIDEYQDTNHAQYILAHALAMGRRNLAVVGDPDQSIYAWRGADIGNILEFETDYPDALVVKLEQNYRSTKTILALASALIARNTQRKEKALWTQNAQGEPGLVLLGEDEHDEAHRVTQHLKKLSGQGRPWSSMAVFYRMNSLSRVIEDALRRANIPYQISRGVEFYNRKEIRDVLAYLRIIANPDDQVSLLRIANVPTRGISDATLKSLDAVAIASGASLFEAMRRSWQGSNLNARAVNAVGNFVKLIESLIAESQKPGTGKIQRLMDLVIKRSGLEAMFLKEDPDRENQVPNVNELLSSAAEFEAERPEGTLDDYLAQVSLVSDADHVKGAGGAVTMMTLHAAKGLEFPVVAIIGLEEGCLPHARARNDFAEMEEERRLCFVGMTRAQETIILSHAKVRTLRGLRERTIPSPFLNELPQDLIVREEPDETEMGYRPGAMRSSLERGTSFDQPCPFHKGQLVRHPGFGVGRIYELSDSGSGTRAVIDFTSAGRKTLLLQYVHLQAVT